MYLCGGNIDKPCDMFDAIMHPAQWSKHEMPSAESGANLDDAMGRTTEKQLNLQIDKMGRRAAIGLNLSH